MSEEKINLKIECLVNLIESSYSNNSKLYKYFETKSSIEEIFSFLTVESKQPRFYDYINASKDIANNEFYEAINEQLDDEVTHSELYRDMLINIQKYIHLSVNEVSIDDSILKTVHSTFEPDFVKKMPFAHFVGGFLATEYMSCRRYTQILKRLKELKVKSNDIEFIVIHSEVDSEHSNLAIRKLVRPLILKDIQNENDRNYNELITGVIDRLKKSENFIIEYEKIVKLRSRNEQE